MQIDYRAPAALPGLSGRIVNLRIGRVLYVESQDRAIRQEGPSFLGIKVTLSYAAEQRPCQRCRVQRGHLHVQFTPYDESAVRKNHRGRIANVIPARRSGQGSPGVSDRVIDCTEICKGKLAVVIFAARNDDSTVGKDRRGEILGYVTRLERSHLRPGS